MPRSSKLGALSRLSIAAATAALVVFAAHSATAGEPSTKTAAAYEAQASAFKPRDGLAAPNSNDARQFIYEWFTHFEHASSADFYLRHLDDKTPYVAFPGAEPITSPDAFAKWYDNLLAQTLWNFHDVSAIQVTQTGPQAFQISFLVDWYGEVKADSPQVAGWRSRPDSNLYHRKLRQTWTVRVADRFVIERLVVTVA